MVELSTTPLKVLTYSVTLVFGFILQNPNPKFYLYLFVALIPWNFFSACLTGGASCVVQQQSLVNKIYFPREVVPIAYVTSSFVNMLYCEIVVFAVCIIAGVHFSIAGLLCLPLVMLVEYIFALGITMIISAIDVYFRDLEHILGIVAMAWMFMTPIMYDISMAPAELMPVFRLKLRYVRVGQRGSDRGPPDLCQGGYQQLRGGRQAENQAASAPDADIPDHAPFNPQAEHGPQIVPVRQLLRVFDGLRLHADRADRRIGRPEIRLAAGRQDFPLRVFIPACQEEIKSGRLRAAEQVLLLRRG